MSQCKYTGYSETRMRSLRLGSNLERHWNVSKCWLCSSQQSKGIFSQQQTVYKDHRTPSVKSNSSANFSSPLQAIHKLTEYLCFQVRNIAQELVDAFDLPDHVTRAPIAMQSNAYSQYTQYVGFWLPTNSSCIQNLEAIGGWLGYQNLISVLLSLIQTIGCVNSWKLKWYSGIPQLSWCLLLFLCSAPMYWNIRDHKMSIDVSIIKYKLLVAMDIYRKKWNYHLKW